MAYAAGQAGTDHQDVKTNIGVLTYAVSLLKPLALQLQNATKRKELLEERLEASTIKIDDLMHQQNAMQDELETVQEHIDFINRGIEDEKALKDAHMHQAPRDPPQRPAPAPSLSRRTNGTFRAAAALTVLILFWICWAAIFDCTCGRQLF
eukprot:1156618-Pyramimonas_sp.AAC.1